MKYGIGVDLGGTFTKIGLINDGKVYFSDSFSSPRDKRRMLDELSHNIVKLLDGNSVTFDLIDRIGIAVAGPIKEGDKAIESITNLPIKNFDIIDGLRERLKISNDVPIRLINDADSAALAEFRYGSGVGYSDMALITVGTGIGCGIIIDGKLYNGKAAAGEIGHTVIMAGGRICGGCGKRGCLESYASVTALIRSANKYRRMAKQSMLNNYQKLNGEIVFDCYFAKDEAAIKAVDQFIYYLSVGITNLYLTLSPECIVIGGGISGLGDKLITLITERVLSLSKGFSGTSITKIVCATLQGNAGIIGACVA